jgi:hypothetical protein
MDKINHDEDDEESAWYHGRQPLLHCLPLGITSTLHHHSSSRFIEWKWGKHIMSPPIRLAHSNSICIRRCRHIWIFSSKCRDNITIIVNYDRQSAHI